MEALEEQLRTKTAELEELRRSFDDFVESSKELEAEFDKSLAASESEIKEKDKKLAAAEEAARQAREECSRLRKDSGTLQAELSSAKARIAQLEETKRLLESQNEDVSNRVRILEASEEDFKRKLEEAEEDIVFLNNDLEDLKVAKQAADEEQTRLRSQVETLEAREASSSYNSAMMAAAENTIAELQAAIKEFEEKEKAVKALAAAPPAPPAPQPELEQLVASLQSQLTARSADRAALLEEVRCLKEQLLQRDQHADCGDVLPPSQPFPHPTDNDTDAEDEPSTVVDGGEKSSEEIDFAAQTLTFSQPGPAPLKIQTVSSLMTSLLPILESSDIDLVKAELRKVSERYEIIRNSNSMLMNKLQAIRGNILVCCRTRPASDQELSAGGKVCVDAYDDVELLLFDNRVWKSFAFDRVWKDDANQVDVFADVEPMVHSVLDGFNSCVFAYGQTGSGKTHTMDGTADQHGVSYRAMQTLFDQLQYRKAQAVSQFRRRGTALQTSATSSNPSSKTVPSGKHANSDFEFTNPLKKMTAVREVKGEGPGEAAGEASVPTSTDSEEDAIFKYKVEISMMEIYNEQVYDLLHDSAGGGQTDGQSLDIRQSAENVVSVPGLKSLPVHNMEETLLVFTRGKRNRATASTNLNEHSSRSHLIIQVEVVIEVADGVNGPGGEDSSSNFSSEAASHAASPPPLYTTATTSKLYLVDLAGSERIKKSGVVGNTMKEALYINKSLLALGDVMEALDQKQKHIPYRNSKLTFLLQNALGGAARAMMIVTVCPTDLTYEETLFTLQFAQRVRNISLGPIQRTHLHSKNLELTIKMLKAELKEVKKAKALLEEACSEMKKEQKRLQEKSSTALENKLRASEEAKRGVDVLAQHLQKQLNDVTARYNEERETKERATSEMDLCQRNLKRALEQLKEHMLEADRMQSTLRAKDREIESVRGALLRAYNASMTPTSASAAATVFSGAHADGEAAGDRRSPSAGRASEGSRVVFSLDDRKDGQNSLSPVTRSSSPTKPALKHSSTGASANSHASAAAAGIKEKDHRTYQASYSPPSQSGVAPSQRLSFFSTGVTTPQSRPAATSQPAAPSSSSSVASAPTASTRTTAATPVAKSTPTTAKSRHSTGTTTTPMSASQRMPSGLLQDPRASSASRARPLGGANGVNTATPSPTVAKRRQATAVANPTPRSSLAAIAEEGGHHAAGTAAQSSVAGSVTAKMPILSARSEEALRRHQLRMEKRREAMANQKVH